jgi:hypothetical protein
LNDDRKYSGSSNGKEKTAPESGREGDFFPYEDIVNFPHPVSRHHVPMTLLQRAAQFAPFAALTGYDDAIEETARQTDDPVTLSESEIAVLNRKLQILEEMRDSRPEVSVTYFVPDQRKKGGEYRIVTGYVKKIDRQRQLILMDTGEWIFMNQLVRIEENQHF